MMHKIVLIKVFLFNQSIIWVGPTHNGVIFNSCRWEGFHLFFFFPGPNHNGVKFGDNRGVDGPGLARAKKYQGPT